jgi:hypothetical protein
MSALFKPRSFSRNWARAAADVHGLSPAYQHFAAKGVAFQRTNTVSQDLYQGIIKKIGSSLETQPTAMRQYADALGIPVQAIGNWFSKSAHQSDVGTWSVNDVAMLSSIYNHMGRGLEEDAAIAAARDEMFTYRLPVEHALAQWASHPDISWFAAYHYDLFRILARAGAKMLGTRASLADRQRVLGQVITTTALLTVIQPAVNLVLNSVLPERDKKHWKIQTFGVAELPAVAAHAILGSAKWNSVMGRMWSAPAGTTMAMQAFPAFAHNQSLGDYLLAVAGSPIGLQYHKKETAPEALTDIFLGYFGILTESDKKGH